jgi:hypothetical protein
VFPVGSAVAVGSGGDGGVQVADKLKIFKTDKFDPDAYVQSKCQTMNEKVSPLNPLRGLDPEGTVGGALAFRVSRLSDLIR